MLSLTKKTEYALIALCYLSDRQTQTVSAREISEAFNMPAALVMNILKTLHHNEMLSSTRGTKGGYRLICDLGNLSLHDLIEVLEGPVQLTECSCYPDPSVLVDKSCKVTANCPIQRPIRAIHKRMTEFLKDVKLTEIIGVHRGNGEAKAELTVARD